MPHFTWDISLGQVVVSIPLFWIIWTLVRISSSLLKFRMEHEILMVDWAARQVPPVRLHEMPTRQTTWW